MENELFGDEGNLVEEIEEIRRFDDIEDQELTFSFSAECGALLTISCC